MAQKETQQVFITRFNYSISTGEMKNRMSLVAPEFSNIPGCLWKIWLFNEDRKEAGGVYLFESPAALEQYRNSALLAFVIHNPDFSHFYSAAFSVETAASSLTRAPLTSLWP